jgi:hypothetical protein
LYSVILNWETRWVVAIHKQLNFLGYGFGYVWDTHNWQYTRGNWKTRVPNRQYTRDNRNIRVSNRQYTRQPALEYNGIKFLLFLHVFSFISNEYDKIKCFKKSVVGYIVGWITEYFGCLRYIVSYGYPTRTQTHTRGNSVAHVWSLPYRLERI